MVSTVRSRRIVNNTKKKSIPTDNSISKHSFVSSFESKAKYITSGLEGSFRIHKVINKKLEEKISTNIDESNIIRNQAASAFANFSLSKFPYASEDPAYVDNKNGLEKGLEKAQKYVSKKAVESVLQDNREHGIDLNLTENQLVELGLKKRRNETIDFTKLMQHINNNTSSLITALSASGCAISEEGRVKQVDEIIDGVANDKDNSVTENKNVEENGINDGDNPSIATNKIVKEKVDLQVKTMTSPEMQLRYDIPDHIDEKAVNTSIQAFELRGGPIDVTSYHDFFGLRIAFRNVWTEVFSKELILFGQSLYEEFLRLKDFNVNTNEIKAVNSIDELRDLMYRLRTERERIAGNDSRYNSVKKILPEMSLSEWARLESQSQDTLYELFIENEKRIEDLKQEYKEKIDEANKFSDSHRLDLALGNNDVRRELERLVYQAIALKSQIEKGVFEDVISRADAIVASSIRKPSRLEKLFSDIEQRIGERYLFDIFAPNSVNFGILINYRQEWKPLNFQVGDLISTIPLAPGEIRRYSKKKVVKTHRAQKEIEDSIRVRKTESAQTARIESEIVQKAGNKTNFHHTSEGSFDILIADVEGTDEITVESGKESTDTKKDFRESVLKAAEEYRQEHRLEISSEISEEAEETSSGEIKNPNDEIPVTYLFYELQRTYEVSEKIYSVRPVILVANDVPGPDEIDEEWLMRHDWILRRVILDDSFLPALNYLTKGFVGNELALEALQNNMEKQLEVVERMSSQVEISTRTFSEFQKALDRSVKNYANAVEAKSKDGGLFDFITDLFTGEDVSDPEAARIRMQGATDALMRAERRFKELQSQAEVELTALQVAVDKYNQAIREHFNWRAEIGRLRMHVKENILYYMQAIWNHEPADQRFFRLYKIKVPLEHLRPLGTLITRQIFTPRGTVFRVGSNSNSWGTATSNVQKELHEIADLDKLLGYKGNYMIFPLKETNYLVNYMLQDFIEIHMDTVYLRDPDEFGNYTLEEIKEHMQCLYKENPSTFDKLYRDKFRKILTDHLTSGRKEKDMIIVPTDSLYIEALPGKHPLLEDFKLIHRALDVKKVQADVRHAELENIRLAARALKGKYEDPDIEKKIIIEGDSKASVIASDNT